LGGNNDCFAILVENEVFRATDALPLHVETSAAHHFVSVGVSLRVEISLPIHDIGKHLVSRPDRVSKGRFRRYRQVQIRGIDDDIPHRPLYPSNPAADDFSTDRSVESFSGSMGKILPAV
jgi:hypothetical protein